MVVNFERAELLRKRHAGGDLVSGPSCLPATSRHCAVVANEAI
jgi:hypothetical protein